MNYKKSQKTENSDLEKEIPLKITDMSKQPIDLRDTVKKEVPVQEEEDTIEKRIKQVVEDIKRLKAAIQNYLLSSYRLKLSEEELDDLTRKIISALASIVADITVDRVENLAETTNVLLPKSKK